MRACCRVCGEEGASAVNPTGIQDPMKGIHTNNDFVPPEFWKVRIAD